MQAFICPRHFIHFTRVAYFQHTYIYIHTYIKGTQLSLNSVGAQNQKQQKKKTQNFLPTFIVSIAILPQARRLTLIY